MRLVQKRTGTAKSIKSQVPGSNPRQTPKSQISNSKRVGIAFEHSTLVIVGISWGLGFGKLELPAQPVRPLRGLDVAAEHEQTDFGATEAAEREDQPQASRMNIRHAQDRISQAAIRLFRSGVCRPETECYASAP